LCDLNKKYNLKKKGGFMRKCFAHAKAERAIKNLRKRRQIAERKKLKRKASQESVAESNRRLQSIFRKVTK
jgi:hypothetical protein